MGRRKRIADDATPTTIYLTPAEQLAVHTVQARRAARRKDKPTQTEVLLEGLRLLLKREGISQSQIDELVPKREAHTKPKKVVPFRKNLR